MAGDQKRLTLGGQYSAARVTTRTCEGPPAYFDEALMHLHRDEADLSFSLPVDVA